MRITLYEPNEHKRMQVLLKLEKLGINWLSGTKASNYSNASFITYCSGEDSSQEDENGEYISYLTVSSLSGDDLSQLDFLEQIYKDQGVHTYRKEEEKPQLKFMDKCLVWGKENIKVERIYLGSHNGRHLATEYVDITNGCYSLGYWWDNAEPLPLKKKMTLEQIQEALGYEIELTK